MCSLGGGVEMVVGGQGRRRLQSPSELLYYYSLFASVLHPHFHLPQEDLGRLVVGKRTVKVKNIGCRSSLLINSKEYMMG
jgi:hypothetical protein